MKMPWRRFEALYKAHAKRKAVQSAEDSRNAMIAGLWGNSNFDDDKQTREKALKEINENFNKALIDIYNGVEEEEDLTENPFFAAMKVPGEELLNTGTTPIPTTTTEAKVEVDQA